MAPLIRRFAPPSPRRAGRRILIDDSIEAAHGDGADRAARRAEAAADADLFVLEHDRAGARQRRRARGRHDHDAVLGADVLASAAEDAFGAARRALLEDGVRPAAQATAPLPPRR